MARGTTRQFVPRRAPAKQKGDVLRAASAGGFQFCRSLTLFGNGCSSWVMRTMEGSSVVVTPLRTAPICDYLTLALSLHLMPLRIPRAPAAGVLKRGCTQRCDSCRQPNSSAATRSSEASSACSWLHTTAGHVLCYQAKRL